MEKPKAGVVSLLTDFGLRDHYVAAVKGVLLAANPGLTLVDVTHLVAPQNVLQGSFLLAASYHFFPPGTVHLAVVDPGVGGERAPLAAKAGGHLFVGPDNGIFDLAFERTAPELVVRLENRRYLSREVSPTFHGRDLFAPAAALLSLGVSLEELGPSHPYERRLPPLPRLVPGATVTGEIIHVDHFGNLISNIRMEAAAGGNQIPVLEVRLGSTPVLWGPATYEQAPPRTPFALVGSHGFLEIAVRGGSAAACTNCAIGARVVVTTGR